MHGIPFPVIVVPENFVDMDIEGKFGAEFAIELKKNTSNGWVKPTGSFYARYRQNLIYNRFTKNQYSCYFNNNCTASHAYRTMIESTSPINIFLALFQQLSGIQS